MPVRARFRPHRRGFGFLRPVAADGVTETVVRVADNAGAMTDVDSVFVPPRLARGFIADDLVDAEVEIDDKGANARSARLVERARRMLVGTVQHGPGRLVVEPDPQLGSGWLQLQDNVTRRLQTSVGRQVTVLCGDGEDGAPVGRALVAGPHVVGSPAAIRAAAAVVALGRAAPSLIPGGASSAGLDPVEAQTTHTRLIGVLAGGGRGASAGLSTDGPIPGRDMLLSDRRDEPCVTIDDAATRDIDDAVTAFWDGEADSEVVVGVHIADVAAVVGVDSPADRYARTVAATAYLAVGPNAPMLDPALAEDALSLHAGAERQALSVRFTVDPRGVIGDVFVESALVRSRAQLSYEALERWLDGDPALLDEQSGDASTQVADVLTAALEASRRLGVQRDARTTFEDLFASAEVAPAIVDGKFGVVPAEPHAQAYRLIERVMVAANEGVAAWLVSRDVPSLYRAHVGLEPERLERLRAATALADADVPALDDPDAEVDQVVAEVLAEVERLDEAGREADRDLLVAAATASTARAAYEPDPAGHRGLGTGAYVHFTSPIRRYADLVVHRQIRAALADEPPPRTPDDLRRLAPWLDARSGAMSFLAARERGDLWARLLDRGYLDGREPAVVTDVTSNGLRVRLPRLGLTAFITAERALGLPGGERGRLEVDEHGLTTTSGPWRVGSHVEVRYVTLDDTGRPVFRL